MSNNKNLTAKEIAWAAFRKGHAIASQSTTINILHVHVDDPDALVRALEKAGKAIAAGRAGDGDQLRLRPLFDEWWETVATPIAGYGAASDVSEQ